MTSFERAFFILLLIFSMNQGHALAQYTNVKISDRNNPNEPSIVFDPNNPTHMLAACNVNKVYVSDDAGHTWISSILESPYGVWGDPALMVDDQGAFYFFHLSNPSNGSWIDRIVCQRSTNFGQDWDKGHYVGLNGNKAQDKEWPAFDKKNKAIYLTWTQFDKYGSKELTDSSSIMFSRSNDYGNTWTTAKRINQVNGDCIDDDRTVEGAVPAVGPDGEVYVSWAGPQGLVFDRSTDGGVTWLKNDIVVNEIGGGWSYKIPGIMRSNGLPVTKCDTSSSPHRGTIYINWSDQINGADDTDIWLVKSNDGGDTWSAPKRVNDDAPGSHQFFTWMDVDQSNGKLYFVFYDRRNHKDGATDVYMAISEDGGETFQNIKISESPFTSTTNTIFFGDYTNIMAQNDIIRPIWTRLDSTKLSVWTAIVDKKEVVYHEPTPSIPSAIGVDRTIDFRMCRAHVVDAVVEDSQGAVIARVGEGLRLDKGKNNLTINQQMLSPGKRYVLKLYDRGRVVKRKLFVVE